MTIHRAGVGGGGVGGGQYRARTPNIIEIIKELIRKSVLSPPPPPQYRVTNEPPAPANLNWSCSAVPEQERT